jgi:hypothetical protein
MQYLIIVMCRWHVRLDVSWVLTVANLTEFVVLCLDPKPLMVKVFCEQTGFQDGIRRFCCDSTGEYPGQTR